MTLKSERIKITNGIHLNLIRTDKFKSNLLSYYFLRPLSKDEVTKNALLPLVLKRGTEEYSTNLEIQKKLEETYGANLSISINKRGEKHVLRFTVETVNGNYVKDKDYIYEVVNLLKSIIYNPVLEKGYFKKDYVEQEKENLRRKIEGRINDKRSYAIDRCIEEMCKNEKFSIYPLGNINDLESIDENILYEHYQRVINTSPIEIFYVGEYDENLIECIKNIGKIERNNVLTIPREQIISGVQTKNMVQEKLDVTQGKLVLGYRTGIPYEDRLYNGLIVASDILGGGPNSKLFRNVREKESLAYYITSTVFKYKSIMLIDGGIEFDNFEKTIDIVKEQLEEIKNGNFTDEDIDIAKKSIKSSTESIKDSIFLISEYFFSQILSEDNRSLEEILNDVNSVTREEIMEAMSKVALDTIYFMKNSKA
ncbi:pitrilysin family protein [Tissierella praeacuta]|uniref:EF-P 5-aminopentanol modification-associated protein YfmF n=1 Tax=Tissierella praeacuta TaxID=43131 RepID=UPI003340D60D